jgi:hypothetical protein
VGSRNIRLARLAASAAGVATLAPAAWAEEDSRRELELVEGAFRMGPSLSEDASWLMKARGFVNMDTMPGIHPLFGAAREVAGFAWSAPRPGPLHSPDARGAFHSPLGFAVEPARNGLAALRDSYGLRTDLYEAATFSAASATLPGARSTFGSSRLNARVDALLWRSEGMGMGRATIQVRQNNLWPESEGSVSSSLGSAMLLNTLENETDTLLARAQFAQSLADDRLIVTVGKFNPGDFVGLNAFASDETTQFLALPFDGNDAFPVAFQNYTPGVALQALPAEWLYASAVLGSAQGARNPMLDFDLERGMFVAAEAGFLFEFLDMPGRASVAWCGSNANEAVLADPALPEIWGNAWLGCVQLFLREHLGVWAQYATADDDIALLARHEAALGVTIDDCFGRRGDGFGLALGLAEAIDPAARRELLVESFYRLQLTGFSQVSLDVQVLAPSSSREVDDAALVGTLRWVSRF